MPITPLPWQALNRRSSELRASQAGFHARATLQSLEGLCLDPPPPPHAGRKQSMMDWLKLMDVDVDVRRCFAAALKLVYTCCRSLVAGPCAVAVSRPAPRRRSASGGDLGHDLGCFESPRPTMPNTRTKARPLKSSRKESGVCFPLKIPSSRRELRATGSLKRRELIDIAPLQCGFVDLTFSRL